MSKFTQSLEGHPGSASGFIGRLDLRITILLNRSRRFGLHPNAIIAFGGSLFIALTGWIHFQTIHGFNFEYFYLFGCAVVGWIGGARAGLASVVFAAAVLFLADLTKTAALAPWI